MERSLTRTLALRAVQELSKLLSLAVQELSKLRSLAAVLQRDRRRAPLAGQANIVERKRIAELRDRLRGPLTARERDLTARELTRLEGELAKSLYVIGKSIPLRKRPEGRLRGRGSKAL